jgi:hypothetical protein
MIQKLFEKYGGAIPALPRTIRALPPDPCGRFTGRHFLDVNLPTITCHQRYVVCMVKREWKDTKYRCSDCNVSLCPVPCFRIYHSL